MSAEPARAIWFLDDAEDDITAAFEWYESKRVGLGAEFVHALDAILAALLDFPESCQVFYRLEDEFLVVVACIRAARDPKVVLRRIGG